MGSTGSGTRRAGSGCLCGSNSILLTFGFFLWIITTLLFLIGGISDKLVCQTLEHPNSSELYNATNAAFDSLFHDILGIDDIANETFSYDEIIESCKNDGSIYSVFHLDFVYNISVLEDWKTTYNISGVTDDVLAEVEKGVDGLVDATTINQDIKDGILEIADSFTNLTGNIFESIKAINISDLVPKGVLDNVTSSLDTLPPGIAQSKIDAVTNSIETIEGILSKDVPTHFGNITDLVETLENELNYNETCDISCVVDEVLELADSATKHIDDTTRRSMVSTTNFTIGNITELGTGYEYYL